MSAIHFLAGKDLVQVHDARLDTVYDVKIVGHHIAMDLARRRANRVLQPSHPATAHDYAPHIPLLQQPPRRNAEPLPNLLRRQTMHLPRRQARRERPRKALVRARRDDTLGQVLLPELARGDDAPLRTAGRLCQGDGGVHARLEDAGNGGPVVGDVRRGEFPHERVHAEARHEDGVEVVARVDGLGLVDVPPDAARAGVYVVLVVDAGTGAASAGVGDDVEILATRATVLIFHSNFPSALTPSSHGEV